MKSTAWQRVVAELTASAPDDRTFLMRMVGVLGHVAGARQAVLYGVARSVDAPGDEGGDGAGGGGVGGGADFVEPRVLLVWPPQGQPGGAEGARQGGEVGGGVGGGGGGGGDAGQVSNASDMAGAARRAAGSGQAHLFGFEQDELFYGGGSGSGSGGVGGGGGGHVIAVPVRIADESPSGNVYVVSLLIEGRSKPALQTTLALVELVAGYAHGHRAGQQLRRLKMSSAALDLAARLIGAINAATSFKGAVLQLANDLVRQLQADRVAIGWTKGIGRKGEGETIHAIAMSDSEHIDRRMAMIQKIEGAMDECLDQAHPVMFPTPPEQGPGSDVVLATAITHAHRELAAGNAGLRVVSLPLRVDERVIGVVTIESGGVGSVGGGGDGSGGGVLDAQTVELVQAVLDLVAPVLRIRRSDDRMLPLRAWDDALRASSWVVGSTHTVWKVSGALVVALALVLTLVKVPYRVESPAELRPREQRVLSSPFDGVIAGNEPGIEPGVKVVEGQLLATMDTSELKLQAINARGQILQAEKQADAALASGKLSEAQQARAKADQARAELDLLDLRIEQARLVAPIDGTIIAGDLRERVGSSVKLGDALFQIAPLDDMLMIARVGDRDISLIEMGGRGSVATKAYPAQRHAFSVERVVPLSQAEEGKNAFQVRAKLENPAGWMRPGMEGFAKFDAGEHSLAWIGTRRIRETLRLWLWW